MLLYVMEVRVSYYVTPYDRDVMTWRTALTFDDHPCYYLLKVTCMVSFPTLCELNSLLMIHERGRFMSKMEVKFWGLLFKTPIIQSQMCCMSYLFLSLVIVYDVGKLEYSPWK